MWLPRQFDQSIFETALGIADRLPAEMAQALERPRSLYSPILGMLYNVAQRLIDAKAAGSASNAPDEALILLCNRLFNESFAGYVLISRGLIGASQHHLRSALETTNLASLIVLRPDLAAPWLNGREYSPGKVRSLLDVPAESGAFYARLSKITHANVAASQFTVLPADGGQKLSYGGYLAPRTAALEALAFVYLPLTFLHLFYEHNASRLRELGLLWSPDVAAWQAASRDEMTWGTFLTTFAKLIAYVEEEIRAMPEDDVRAEALAAQILATGPASLGE